MRTNRILIAAATLTVLAGLLSGRARQDAASQAEEPPFAGPTETATFSGGCFWGLQAAFEGLPGVVATRAGYTGGRTDNPKYEQVITGKTGHAEAVEAVFDPEQVSYEQLVRHFFAHHRSTSGEPAANYSTRAYRSAIFIHSPGQRETAERVVSQVVEENQRPEPVATLIEEAGPFWEAEDDHQNYLARCTH